MEQNDYVSNKLKHALSFREASERLVRENINNTDAAHKCFQTLSISNRLVEHFEKKIKNVPSSSLENSISLYNIKFCFNIIFRKNNFDNFSGYLKSLIIYINYIYLVSLPFIFNGQYRSKRSEIRKTIYVYMEATYNDDISQSSFQELDQHNSQFLNFNLKLYIIINT